MAEQRQNRNRNQAGAGDDLAEGGAVVAGGAAGATLGSVLGPLGTVAGAVAGGAMADEAVETTQSANQGEAANQRRQSRDTK